MADEFQYDVFLSHSSKDKTVVRAVAERLRKDGLRVWLDDWEIRAGDGIPAKIEEGLVVTKLKQAILRSIRWDDIPSRLSPLLFKRLKEEIVRLNDEDRVLMRFNELREMHNCGCSANSSASATSATPVTGWHRPFQCCW